jgi:glycosyltransferase involved in cell wall biosynthesis
MTDQVAVASTSSQQHSHNPAVSVIIPAYNVARYIAAALNSVFVQTFRDFEVIVVNDGSPDTAGFEEALQPFRDAIVYIKQENGGPSAARNTGIRIARGEYLAFLDADDVWESTYLSEQMNAFSVDQSLDLHYLDALLIGDSVFAGRTFMEMVPSDGPATLEALLTMKCSVITSCVVLRRQTAMTAGLFDPELRYSEDFDLWVRLAARGARLGYRRRVLAFHRLHPLSLTATGVGLLQGQIRVYQKLADSGATSPETREIIVHQLARAHATLALEEGKRLLMAGDYRPAAASIAKANEYYSSRKLRAARMLLAVAPRGTRCAYVLWRFVLAIRKPVKTRSTA